MTGDDRLLLHAMLDGELDASTQREVEQRLRSEPELAKAYDNLRRLQDAMRSLPHERAPETLRERMAALAAPAPIAIAPTPSRRSVPRGSFSGRSLMAASVAALLVGAAGGWVGGTRTGLSVQESLVASHVRGLIAARPFDVASSEGHTVRPWFAGKLAVAPFVADLASAGFPLEGGRIDVVDGEPEPTLVYRRGPHVISVTRLPGKVPSLGGTHGATAGLAVLRWGTGDANYVAVSDAAPAELDALRSAFDAAHAADGTVRE